MSIKYYKLFYVMQREGVKKSQLVKPKAQGGLGIFTRPTFNKLENGEIVSMDIIYKLCVLLHCQPGDIMEISTDEYTSELEEYKKALKAKKDEKASE